MIHFKNAPMTHAAMVSSWWPRRYTLFTDGGYNGYVLQNKHT